MHCDEAADLIGPYVDDDLPTEARRRVEDHLLACRVCAWDAMTLHITRERLRDGIGEVVASDAFRARVAGRLHSDNPHLDEPEEAAVDAAQQYRLPLPL
jgi:anti-sigma factor RsiW